MAILSVDYISFAWGHRYCPQSIGNFSAFTDGLRARDCSGVPAWSIQAQLCNIGASSCPLGFNPSGRRGATVEAVPVERAPRPPFRLAATIRRQTPESLKEKHFRGGGSSSTSAAHHHVVSRINPVVDNTPIQNAEFMAKVSVSTKRGPPRKAYAHEICMPSSRVLLRRRKKRCRCSIYWGAAGCWEKGVDAFLLPRPY